MPTIPEPKDAGAPAFPADKNGSAVARNSTLRTAVMLLARYQIRNLRRVFEEFERDILLPILLGEIALHNIGAFEHRPPGLPNHDPAAGPEAHEGQGHVPPMRPCNAYSISAATGLPRETVRRKIGRLVELGWIHKQGNGHLYLTERAFAHFGSLMNSRDLPEFLETADRVRRVLND
jgi:hypothetical protein